MEPNQSKQDIKHGKFYDAIVLSKQTLDILLRHPRPGDMISLLVFYHYTGLWQGTNQPHATVHYVMRGLHWGKDKVRRVRRELTSLGLIEDVTRVDEQGRKQG